MVKIFNFLGHLSFFFKPNDKSSVMAYISCFLCFLIYMNLYDLFGKKYLIFWGHLSFFCFLNPMINHQLWLIFLLFYAF